MLTLADLDAALNGVNSPRTMDIELRSEAGGTSVATSFSFTCFARVPLDEIDPAFLEENLGSERAWLRIDAGGVRVAATLVETGPGVRLVRAPFVEP